MRNEEGSGDDFHECICGWGGYPEEMIEDVIDTDDELIEVTRYCPECGMLIGITYE